ncbi:tRNA lysidine(34) synthetase TilS [Faucicola mancuniensis]|uniref:tRNA lysidine(34) synthetase TilS n=1 Tax=Faucicola mancuniensis TaxID=1309795 RepID=UPI00397748E1
MPNILTTIQKSYQQYCSTHTNIYIACSGGRDSMALLYACFLLKLPISVLHINHKIQAISDEWQTLVENFCQKNQIPYQGICIDWKNTDISKINENQARNARYQAFCQMIPPHAIIATAHHANDQAETILMNLFHGAGMAGLSGMREFGEQSAFDKPFYLWRPLLPITREQISEFVRYYSLDFVDDPTNIGENNDRAWLRQNILPLINNKFNKSIENIVRSSQNIADSQTILYEIYQQGLKKCAFPQRLNSEKRLNIEQLQLLSRERLLQFLYFWLKDNQTFAPNRQTIEQIYQLIFTKNTEQKTIIEWQGVQIRRYQQILYRLEHGYVAECETLIGAKSLQNGDFRQVLPNEKFKLLAKNHHQSFKKICQEQHIPVWERPFIRIFGRNKAMIMIDKCLLLKGFYEDNCF